MSRLVPDLVLKEGALNEGAVQGAGRRPKAPPPSGWALHAPWTDKKGRLDPVRATVFALLLLPGANLVFTWLTAGLGARPLNVAIHSTGYWAVWILLASLCISPWKALAGAPGAVVLRRMVGIAALAYALAHLVLYVADQNWRLWTVGAEIVSRFYLTIGFVALAVLCVLGATSTDTMVRRLGKRWKGLHKWVYAVALLTAAHFFLQSKADVSQATVAAGVFAWLMLWRQLPAGRDRAPLPLLALAVAAAAVTVVAEYAWYRFGTKVDPQRVLRAELDVSWGLRPGMLVLALGVAVAGMVALRQAAERWGGRAWFTAALYAAGALADDALAFLFGWWPEEPAGWHANAVAAGVFALLGLVRHRLPEGGQRRALDALWAVCAVLPLAPWGGPWFAAAVLMAALGAAAWLVARWASASEAHTRP